jgi:hypothetical protein
MKKLINDPSGEWPVVMDVKESAPHILLIQSAVGTDNENDQILVTRYQIREMARHLKKLENDKA